MASYTENMGSLFDQGLFADCTIIAADGIEFKAHKCILACQSPVFRAMFEHHQMIETKEGIARIKDINSPVLEQMLRFIYTGTAPKLGELAMELLEAAVEYQLDQLKVMCEEELPNLIGNENVCEFIVLADRYSLEFLKITSIDFFKTHAKEVMKSTGWKMFIDGNYLELLDQILKAIFEGLPNSLGNENVFELLVLANQLSPEHHNLLAKAIEYIKLNAKEVMKLDGWKMLVEESQNNSKLFKQILLAICEELPNSIGKENVCELLILANRHSIQYLKTKAIKYIQQNAKEVMESDGWKMFVDGNYEDLLDQILKGILSGLSNSMGNENVCELLVLADRHSAKSLKIYAIRYIQKHANEAMKTNGWKMLVERNHNGLVEQIVNEIAINRRSSMGNDNVCELLILADQYSAEYLKSRAIKYIQMHTKEVMKSNGWKKLVKGNHGKLMEQVMKAFAKH